MFSQLVRRAALGAVLLLAGAAAAQDAQFSEEDYQDERQGYVDEWVVVSDHYKHANNCTSDGCIIMGPMSDHDACQEWSRDYNKIDPLDHSRCVSTQSLKRAGR